MKFEITLIFLIKPFFLFDQKVNTKISTKRSKRTNEKGFQDEIKSIFHPFLKGFQ